MKEFNVQEMIILYQNGTGVHELSKKNSVSRETILRRLKNSNIKINKNNIAAKLDTNLIGLYQNGCSTKKIAKLYKSSHKKVVEFLIKNNIKLRDYRTPRSDIWQPSNQIRIQIINDYLNGISARRLGFKYNVADVTIAEFLKRNNVNIKTRSQAIRNRYGYGLNENVFDEINEESAYWIGFILSDGNVHKGKRNSNSINFGLKASDKNHLEKLKIFFKCTKPLYYNKSSGCFHISFYSKKIQNQLLEFGITERKSKTAKVPENLKNNRYFWRGMVDGDGWVGINSHGYPNIGICGTIDVCQNFKIFFNLSNKIAIELDNFAQIQTTGKRAIEIYKILYKNANIYLDRKYNALKHYLM